MNAGEVPAVVAHEHDGFNLRRVLAPDGQAGAGDPIEQVPRG